jgi:hypothetical protein
MSRPVLISLLRGVVRSVVTFFGPSWDGRPSDTIQRNTICAVPDRNGGRSTFSTVHRPAAREAAMPA